MRERKSWTKKRAEVMSTPGSGAAHEAERIRFELGETVRERREELGLTQAELAGRAGLQQPAIARFEAGGTMPTIPMLERLAEALLLRLSVEFQPLPLAPGTGFWALSGPSPLSGPGTGTGRLMASGECVHPAQGIG